MQLSHTSFLSSQVRLRPSLADDYYCTIGVHPCRANEVFKDGGSLPEYLARIEKTIDSWEHKHKLIAIGECGLDYDRLDYAPAET